MTNPNSLTVASYSSDGKFLESETVDLVDLESQHLGYFRKKLSRLSGDLELPLEDQLPSESGFIDYRIGSDLNGAYVLYYFHDEVVFASLLLSGTDEATETELMQVFKFLLLDTNDQDDPSEEEIEAVLNSDRFDFPSIVQRPAVFEVPFFQREDEIEAGGHVLMMNRHLSAAFFELQQQG